MSTDDVVAWLDSEEGQAWSLDRHARTWNDGIFSIKEDYCGTWHACHDPQRCWRCGGPTMSGIAQGFGRYTAYCRECEAAASGPTGMAPVTWDFDEATFYDHGAGHRPSPA